MYEPTVTLDVINLTNDPGDDGSPRWVPGLGVVSFASDRHGQWRVDPETGAEYRSLQWYLMRPDGSEVTLLTALEPDGLGPTWSPDGDQMVYTTVISSELAWNGQAPTIWLSGRDRLNRRLLTKGYKPLWSPDGGWIAFLHYPYGSDDRQDSELHLIHPDGSGERLLLKSRYAIGERVWSPDGKRIAFLSFGDVHVVDVLTGEVRVLDVDFGGGYCTGWSPDGGWLACDYRDEIYAISLDQPWMIRLVQKEKTKGSVFTNNQFPSWGP